MKKIKIEDETQIICYTNTVKPKTERVMMKYCKESPCLVKREQKDIMKCILEGQSELSRTGRIPALLV